MHVFLQHFCCCYWRRCFRRPYLQTKRFVLSGAVIIAQDDENTFLGKITSVYDTESIFNDYGTHGSEYSSDSIWNQYGTFGSEYSSYSPFNKYTSTPPMIIKNKKIIGYLSANKSLGSAISPNLLKALCKDEL